MWDFSTEPGFADQLAGIDRLVREEIELLDLVKNQMSNDRAM